MLKSILKGVLHTGAGALGFGLAAIATGWKPGDNPLVTVLWTTLGVTAISAAAHALTSYAQKK